MSDPLRTDGSRAHAMSRRMRIATRRSSSCCSSASTITSPPATSSPSTSGRARCSSIAATRGRAPTSSARAARSPSGSANPRSCCRPASPRSSAATATKPAGCCRRRSTAARRRTRRWRCSIASNRLEPRRRPSRRAPGARRRGRRRASAVGGRSRADRRGVAASSLRRRGDRGAGRRRRALERRRPGVDRRARASAGRCSRRRPVPRRSPSRARCRAAAAAARRNGAAARPRAASPSGHLRDALAALDDVRSDRPQQRRRRSPARRHPAAAAGADPRAAAPTREARTTPMKCPKCGYLGFERVDRCRNCGYDFSLTSPIPEPDLHDSPRHARDRTAARRSVARSTPPPSDAGTSRRRRDLDRMFGSRRAAIAAPPRRSSAAAVAGCARAAPRAELPLFGPPIPDDEPLITKASPPRPPLAVRRATPEVPRLRAEPRCGRRRSISRSTSDPTRRGRVPPTPRDRARQRTTGAAPDDTRRRGVGARFVAVVDRSADPRASSTPSSSTSRCRSAASRVDDLGILPKGPLLAFLLVQNGGYLVAFTAGGQTLGKMAAGIRVVAVGSERVARSRPRVAAHARCGSCWPCPPASAS